jgi:predicted PurR-regulated permease PerM
MNKKTYSQVLEDVARDGLHADSDLTLKIMAHVQKGKGATMRPRIKVLVTTIVIVFVLAALLVNVPAVAAAIQRWFGYIPGFGLVHDDQIRELAEPVSLSQGDITLTVEKAILSDEKVVDRKSTRLNSSH